jgi:hypothetical protein
MRPLVAALGVAVATALASSIASAGDAVGSRPGTFTGVSIGVAGAAKTCMEGVDIKASTPLLDVYCGPASAVVESAAIGTAGGKPGTGDKATVKPGTCVKGLRGPGSWDLYLGRDKSGKGPWPLHLHLSKPTASASPGLYMEWRYTQWSAISGIKLTLTRKGGSFSGMALVKKGKTASHVREPIKGTFTC